MVYVHIAHKYVSTHLLTQVARQGITELGEWEAKQHKEKEQKCLHTVQVNMPAYNAFMKIIYVNKFK